MLEVGEAGFALAADGHEASGDGYGGFRGFELLGGGVAVLVPDGGDGVGGGEVVGIGGLAEGLDLVELFLAERELVALEIGVKHWVSFAATGSVFSGV